MGLSRENLGQAPDSVRTRVARPLGGGNYAMQGCDTPATRRQSASHGAKPPPATGLEGAGGSGGPEGLTAVPGAVPRRRRRLARTNFARYFRRSFFETAQKRCNSNEVISMFEQVARELRAKLMGEWPVGPQAASHRRAHHTGGNARSAAAQWPVSGRSAARPCHGLGCSPGVPRRPSRTRRGRTRGRSTGRRAPWPRSCRAP